jgi:hypothetical protein
VVSGGMLLLALCMGCEYGEDDGMRRFVRLAVRWVREVPVERKEGVNRQ